MKKRSMQGIRNAGCSTLLLLGGLAQAQTLPDAGPPAAGLESLQKEMADQAAQLEAMKRALAEQEATIRELRSVIGTDVLARKRGGQRAGPAITPSDAATAAATAAAGASASQAVPVGTGAPQPADQQPPQMVAQPQEGQPQQGESADPQTVAGSTGEPVGKPPERETRPPEIAPIFDQPGVLTGAGKLIVEPGFQYGYSSNNRVALVGFTVIPAILIGLLDVRESRPRLISNRLPCATA